jgi:hypothetical protein
MSDTELLEHFKLYLTVTRPELQTPKQTRTNNQIANNPKLAQGLAIAKQLGINMDVSLLNYKKKK